MSRTKIKSERKTEYKSEYFYMRYTSEEWERESTYKYNTMLEALQAAREHNDHIKSNGNLPMIWYIVWHAVREVWSADGTRRAKRTEEYEIEAIVRDDNTVDLLI